jgi:hypothetical protein
MMLLWPAVVAIVVFDATVEAYLNILLLLPLLTPI